MDISTVTKTVGIQIELGEQELADIVYYYSNRNMPVDHSVMKIGRKQWEIGKLLYNSLMDKLVEFNDEFIKRAADEQPFK